MPLLVMVRCFRFIPVLISPSPSLFLALSQCWHNVIDLYSPWLFPLHTGEGSEMLVRNNTILSLYLLTPLFPLVYHLVYLNIVLFSHKMLKCL